MTEPSAQDAITRFWSAVAPYYEAHPGNVCARGSEEYRAWVRTLARLLPSSPSDVLDVGTGTGFAAAIAAGLGHRVTAIDLAEPMLAEAKTLAGLAGLKVTFLRGDAVAPPFAQQSFDAVLNRRLLWTLRDLDIAARAWRNLLRRGGRLIAIDGFSPIPATDVTGKALYTADIRSNLPGWRYAEASEYISAFEAAGFRGISVENLDDIASVEPEPSRLRALMAYV